MNTEPKLSEIGQIAITVSDVDAALSFYRDVLGLAFLFQPAPSLAFLSAGGVRIMLTPPEGKAKAGHNSLLYFKVVNLAETYRSILDRGAPSEHEPRLVAKMPDHELWMAFVRDPDGNVVGLMEEKR